MNKPEFKKDQFTKNRNNYSRYLHLFCRKCNHLIATYQKDGPGSLRRLYLDRILNNSYSFKNNLICKSCKTTLGTPTIYEKENRKSFRLYQDSVTKKIIRKKN